MILKIIELAEAQDVWRQFYLKYQKVSPAISPNKKNLYEKREVSNEFKEFLNKGDDNDPAAREDMVKAARKLQGFWRKRTQVDRLVKINPERLLTVNSEGNHSSDFNHLLNYDKKKNKDVKKSVNKVKLDKLFMAIEKGNWDDPIFHDETLPQLTLSLFSSNKISQQQTYTILERHQTLKDYKLLQDKPDEHTKGT